jgi:hypothetical protein
VQWSLGLWWDSLCRACGRWFAFRSGQHFGGPNFLVRHSVNCRRLAFNAPPSKRVGNRLARSAINNLALQRRFKTTRRTLGETAVGNRKLDSRRCRSGHVLRQSFVKRNQVGRINVLLTGD